MKPLLQISACCESDTGLVRSYNEDLCLVNNEDCYYLVADGMGGAAAGETASGLFRDAVVERFALSRPQRLDDHSLQELIGECFQYAHSRMLAHVEQQPAHKGMGCTAELLAYRNNRIIIGHVGDSRTYRLRNSRLVQLTTDHSFVQKQAELGLITEEQAQTHALKNLILRAVGRGSRLEVDMIGSDVKPGDLFLLCTDGLTSMVSKKKIKEILCYELVPEIKATMLIDQANLNGGMDNVSVVLVAFTAV